MDRSLDCGVDGSPSFSAGQEPLVLIDSIRHLQPRLTTETYMQLGVQLSYPAQGSCLGDLSGNGGPCLTIFNILGCNLSISVPYH